jgi:hypothetical protein
MTLSVRREQILTALFTKLSNTVFSASVAGTTGFRMKSRRVRLWGEVARELRPAMFMSCHNEIPGWKSANNPVVLEMDVMVYIYIDSGMPDSSNTVPDMDLSAILDGIDSALAPGVADQGRQTLGGLVQHCRVDGSVLRDPGDLDGDGLLMIPIKISVT